MKKKPISKDFKILLLSVLKQGYMTHTDRNCIENYMEQYFDGKEPVEMPPLSVDDVATIIDIEGFTIDDVAAACEKREREKELHKEFMKIVSR